MACCGIMIITWATARPSQISMNALPRGGEAHWVDVAGGRLKTRVYSTEHLSAHPLLVLVLHGDIPDPKLDYHYIFARALTEGYGTLPELPAGMRAALGEESKVEDVVAAAILRPGYRDVDGDKSDGDMGQALADNYTPEVIDAIAQAGKQLKAQYRARAVVLVGHSGGAAIAADVLGRHPSVADAALLIACPSDPMVTRVQLKKMLPNLNWDHPYRSISPISLVENVPRRTRVRLLAGEKDDVVPPELTTAYAEALKARGVDVRATIVPGFHHDDIVFSEPAFRELGSLIRSFSDHAD